MSKLMGILSLISLNILTIGTTVSSDTFLSGIAANQTSYELVRAGLSLMILLLLFTKPPRKSWIRVLTGLAGTSVLSWTLINTYNYAMPLADMLCLIAASITILVAAIEPASSKHRTIPVQNL